MNAEIYECQSGSQYISNQWKTFKMVLKQVVFIDKEKPFLKL